MLTRGKSGGRPPCWILAVLFSASLLTPCSFLAADLPSRLASGEIIVSSENVPGSSVKMGEVTGVVDAPPELVWKVIIDVNHFHEFMPRTLKSQVVAPEQLQLLRQKRPTTAPEVEAILGPAPPDPARFRRPGQKYLEYLYGHLEVPWPLGDRWYIIKMLRDETQAAQHIYTSSWSLELGNLRENQGEWRLHPFSVNQTRLTYRLVTDPGGCVPKFLIQKGTFITLPQVISSVRQRVGQLSQRESTP